VRVAVRWLVGLGLAVWLAGCAAPTITPVPMAPVAAPPGSPEAQAETFKQVVDRVAPVATAICRERTRNVPCDFTIAIDDRLDAPPNAFQTLDKAGHPILVFTVSLIADARNPDELAFIMGHEAAHHIAGHMQRQQSEALAGAIVAGTLATLGGADAAAVQAAQDMGAQIGARRYSKDYELEADALGTEIAWRAGFDPARGALFFGRIPDPGDKFLGTHPPNAQRMAVVQQTLATLR
jgi:predicted Zn-dependent protease